MNRLSTGEHSVQIPQLLYVSSFVRLDCISNEVYLATLSLFDDHIITIVVFIASSLATVISL